MKNNLSFAILAATVMAGLVLSLVDASTVRQPAGSGTHSDANPVEATPSGSIASAQR